MILNAGFLRRFLLGLRLEGIDGVWKEIEAVEELPGAETDVRKRLKLSTSAFISSYNVALEANLTPFLFSELETFDPAFRGFAYEGAGMGMAMLDYTTPGTRQRLLEFIDMAPQYSILSYIGAGLAIAVLNRDMQSSLAPMDPIGRWWAIDGYGFYVGVFKWKKSIERQFIPNKIKGYALRAFDRGIGRSLWFMFSGDITGITKRLQAFPEERHADIWSGIGVASTYAGGVDQEALQSFKTAAGQYASYVALGSALASSVRYFANNIVAHNNLATSVYCGMSAEDAAKLAIKARERLTIDPKEPVFTQEPIHEIFRESIRYQFSQIPVAA